MNHQQMTSEVTEFNDFLPDNTFSESNTIWDQSAKIFTAVVENANLLPEDKGNKIYQRIPSHKKTYRKTRGLNNKARTPLTKYSLAHLQEEHAMWLK